MSISHIHIRLWYIYSKVKIIARLEFELAHNYVVVQLLSHFTTGGVHVV